MKNLKHILLAIGGVVVAWLLRGCFDNSFLRLIYTVIGFPCIAGVSIFLAWMAPEEAADDDRPKKLKRLIEPAIEAMYKAGKTDAEVHWYLKAQVEKCQPKESTLTNKDLEISYFWYTPYYVTGSVDVLPLNHQGRKRDTTEEFRKRMRTLYPRAYTHQIYELGFSWEHKATDMKCYQDFIDTAGRICDHFYGACAQYGGTGSPSNNSIDWEKAATGTAIFGPTGVAMGMTDDKDNR